jgi:D-xylose transport system substrate-binding protein
MGKKKGFALLCFVLILGTFLAACKGGAVSSAGGAAPSGACGGAAGAVKIGVILDNTQVEARVRQRDKMYEVCAEMGVELIFQDSEMNETKQMKQVENMIAQEVDVLVLMPVNYEAVGPAVKDCNDAGIPVVCYGRTIYDADIAGWVGVDTKIVGNVQADYLLTNFPPEEAEGGHQNYILLAGPFTDPSCSIWYEQWYDKLQPYIDEGKITIVGDSQGEAADTQLAMEITENFLTAANDDGDIILAVSDSVATGAAQALESRGLLGSVPMTGLDAETIVLKRVAEGKQSMTIALDDNAFAQAAIKMAVAIAKGEAFETNGVVDNNFKEIPAFFVDPMVIDKDNLIDALRQGYGTVEEVYADLPKDEWPTL